MSSSTAVPSATTPASSAMAAASVHTTCRCGNVSVVNLEGSQVKDDSNKNKDSGETTKSSGFGLRIIKEELTAHRRTAEWLTRRESAAAARRESGAGAGRHATSPHHSQRNRRASNDFPKQGETGSGTGAGMTSSGPSGSGGVATGTSGGRGRRSSRSGGGMGVDDADEEEDGERILVCTVCDEDVGKVKVHLGTDGKVVGSAEVLEVLCEKRTPPTADMETKHALLYPFDLSHLPSSESYGAPPNLPTPPHFTSLLSPLADPFFLPPPFTPSDPYFMQLSKVATEKIKEVRDRVDREILEFVGSKRKEVASVQRRARGECEILWKSYEKACKMRGVKVAGAGSGTKESVGLAFKSGGEGGEMDDAGQQAGIKVHSPAKESFGDPSDSKNGLGLTTNMTTTDTTMGSAMSPSASRLPIRSSVAQTGYGSSLLSASLSVSYFPQNQQHATSVGKAEETTATSTPRPAARSPMKSPQMIEQSFQNIDPVAASGGGNTSTSLLNSNPITAPFNRGTRSGLDLDVVSSLRISHMDERFGVGGAAAGGTASGGTMGSRAVTSETHHSLGRKGNRYHNPLDTDLDVEADDPSPTRHYNNGNNKLDRVVEREEDVREGGEGDITLHPFAESSQVSAASSYKDTGSDDQIPDRSPTGRVLDPERLGVKEPEMLAVRGRRPSSLLVPEEERTPRPRNVKHLSSSSPETMRRLSGSAGNKRSSMGGTREANAAAERKEDDQAPVAAARKKVKFDEAVVEKDDRAQSDKEADDADREEGGGDEPDDVGLISGPEDAVFDFEDHDTPAPKLSGSFPKDLIVDAEAAEASSSPAQQDRKRTMEENTQLVEKKLIQLMAADAPSHRSAWRNDTQKLWQALGQTTNRTFISPSPGKRSKSRSDSDDDEDDEDQSRTSVFATSMPVQIAMPQPSGSRRDLEPKTSLVDRQGMLVPPLKKAMRGQTASYSASHSGRRIEGQHVKANDQDGQDVSISASVSNIAIAPPRQDSTTRNQGRLTSPPAGGYSMRDKGYGGFSVDPGPALESMGTLSEEEEDAYSGSVRAGAPGFIPPHRQDRST